MAGLTFEIWHDPDDDSFGAWSVSEHADNLRKVVSPNAQRMHTFTAESDFDAFQQNYDWHGWGKWKPPEGRMERFFIDTEVEEQRRYLASRGAR